MLIMFCKQTTYDEVYLWTRPEELPAVEFYKRHKGELWLYPTQLTNATNTSI